MCLESGFVTWKLYSDHDSGFYSSGLSRAAQRILELPKLLRSSPSITLALSINKAFLERNPVCVLRLARRLGFLQSCALHRHIVRCRSDLLLIYSHGYSSRNCRFPLDRLAQLLALNASHASELCRAYGLEVTQDSQVVFCKTAFTEPDQGNLHCKQYHSIVADKQKDLTIENIIHGCAWGKPETNNAVLLIKKTCMSWSINLLVRLHLRWKASRPEISAFLHHQNLQEVNSGLFTRKTQDEDSWMKLWVLDVTKWVLQSFLPVGILRLVQGNQKFFKQFKEK